MREISHSDMITKIRNCEGEVLARIEGEEVCCNPTQETLEDLSEGEEVAQDSPESEVEAGAEGSTDDAAAAVADTGDDTDADGQDNPPAA